MLEMYSKLKNGGGCTVDMELCLWYFHTSTFHLEKCIFYVDQSMEFLSGLVFLSQQVFGTVNKHKGLEKERSRVFCFLLFFFLVLIFLPLYLGAINIDLASEDSVLYL